MRNIALTDITLLSGVSVVIFTFLFRALFLRLRHTVNFRWSKRKNQLLLKYPENDNDPLQGCSRAYFSVCDANYLHEAPNKKSFLLVRFTSTFESFIIPLNRKVSEILLCYTEGTVYISYMWELPIAQITTVFFNLEGWDQSAKFVELTMLWM